MRCLNLAAGLAALLIAGLAPPAVRAEEPVNLRVAWTELPSHLLPIVFSRPEVLRHYGKSFTVTPLRFRGSAPEITALASGDLDIAMLGFSSFGLAIQNAHMDDLRIIGDGHRDGVAGYFSTGYFVRRDGGIGRVEDLKGRVVATNSIGGATYFALSKMMRDHGLMEKRDYQVAEVQFPNMVAALDGRKIDLGPMAQPFQSLAEKDDALRPLFTMRDALGETQTTAMVARTPFIAAHRAALVDFFEDFQRGAAWLTDPANRDAAVATLSSFMKEPPSVFSGWLFTHDDTYHDPAERPNLTALQRNLDDLRRLGFLSIAIDVPAYADLSMVDEAARRPR